MAKMAPVQINRKKKVLKNVKSLLCLDRNNGHIIFPRFWVDGKMNLGRRVCAYVLCCASSLKLN